MNVENNLELYKERFRQRMEILNRSASTVKGYLRMLGKFIEFLNQAGVSDIRELTKEHIQDYQKNLFYQLNKKGLQNTAQYLNNHIKAIKGFCSFLRKEEYIPHDPAHDIEYAKTPQGLPRVILTQGEIKKLLKSPDTGTALGYRDRAVLEVLYSTGIRNSELRNLKVQDADYERGYLRVNRGKGGKDRVVPLGKIACKYLESYIKLVRIDLARLKGSQYLFLSLLGNRMDTTTLKGLINKHAKRAKLSKRVTPHVFRHTCATHLIRENANIRCVQEILGHKNLDTTQKYVQLTITDLKETHEKCHPREREKIG